MLHRNEFDDLIAADAGWWSGWQFLLQGLADNETGQVAFWPVDDFVARERYVPCVQRGTHRKITECWLCYGDWVWGHVGLDRLLAPGADQA